ncbi:LysR family transcriptional regulator [Thioclava sp. GXIMD2076]|uniref:LysR family transcriptional regulator n=1 Tax=Thioclava sp. GXIMD2076 TaxID=3131931 RepID=UPI0030CDDBCC
MMDVRALEAFEAAMSCGSMTAAAKQLNIAQPTVTRLVKELEAEVGFDLFHRNGPRITPTDKGLKFHEEARRVLGGLKLIRDRAEAIRSERQEALDIAATPTMAGGLVAPALQLLAEDLPQDVDLQTMTADHVVEALRNRTADLGIAGFPLDATGLVAHVLCESTLVVALSDRAARAYPDGRFPLRDLAGKRLISAGNRYRLRPHIDAAMQAARIRPSGSITSNSSLNAIMAARAELGVAIIDPVTAYGIPVKGTTILPLDTPIPYLWGLFSDSHRVTTPAQTRFAEMFRQVCADLIPDCRFPNPSENDAIAQTSRMLP